MMYRTLLLAALNIHFALVRAQEGGQVRYASDPAATARQFYERGALDSALVHADRALRTDAADAALWKLRGDIRQRMKDNEGALQDYKQSEALDPSNPRLFVSRSALRITEGNLKGALKDLERAAELAPDDPDVWYNRACVRYLQNDNAGALRDAEKALKLAPDHAEGLFLAGVAKGELYREGAGMDDIERALTLDPSIPGGRMSGAILLFEMKRYEEAIQWFTQVIEAGGDETDMRDAHYYRGDCHYELDNKELACADWRASAQLGDKDATFIRRSYCDTDARRIPKKPNRQRRKTVVSF